MFTSQQVLGFFSSSGQEEEEEEEEEDRRSLTAPSSSLFSSPSLIVEEDSASQSVGDCRRERSRKPAAGRKFLPGDAAVQLLREAESLSSENEVSLFCVIFVFFLSVSIQFIYNM